jgi:spore maturation protein CgeB
MKILLIGKDNPLSWTKHISEAIQNDTDINVETIYINKLGFIHDLTRNFKKLLSTKDIYKSTKVYIENKIQKINPDVILVISPFGMNETIFESFNSLGKNIIKLAWIGDLFGPQHKVIANYFNKLYMTDTYFIELSKKYNFPESSYLPLAANTNIFYNVKKEKNNKLLFIGAFTNDRLNLINAIQNQKIHVIGPKWKNTNENITYDKKHIDLTQVAYEYNVASTVLNIKHEKNVVNGLNMRSFEVPACKTCLIQDNLKDIEYNFEINKDILVYNSIEELNELLAKLQVDTQIIQKISQNGYKRVISSHTYEHRLQTILKDIN